MKTKQQGFTIVELLIATTVFSVVMILCLAAFLRVGQLYYKGIYLARTQEAARNISDDIVNQLRLNGGGSNLSHVGNVYYMCAGSKRYSFMSNNVVNTSTETTTNYGLVRDPRPAGGGCASPTAMATKLVNPVELLSDKMRVVATGTGAGQSDINDICSPLGSRVVCKVSVHVEFGDNDLLVNPSNPANDFTSAVNVVPGGICSGPLQGSQFCATSDLNTTVYPLQ